MAPLTVGKTIIGVVEFTCTSEPRDWTPDLVAGLQLTVQIFASAIDRKRSGPGSTPGRCPDYCAGTLVYGT